MSAEGSIEESLRKIDEEGIAKGWDGAIITLEKDGQIKVKYQKRVVWDGSPIESEVLYHFNSTEDIKKAFANRPEMLEWIDEILNNSSVKVKAKENSKLASGSWSADASHNTGCSSYYCYGHTTNPSDKTNYGKAHEIAALNDGVWDYDEIEYPYWDSDEHDHYLHIYYIYECPCFVQHYSRIMYGLNCMAGETDQGSCD